MNQSPLPQNRPLNEGDIKSLITAQVREDRSIEFKGEFSPQTDGGKKKFLQSVAAFSNSRGGDLVFGIRAVEGVAKEIAPIAIDPDQTRIQLSDLIRVHLRPRPESVEIISVPIAEGGYVIVVRVRHSWGGPHILNYNDDKKFYVRGDGGNRPMEYEEVRDGFLGGEAIASKLRNFRMERCSAIINDEGYTPLKSAARIVIHILPLDSVSLPNRFPLSNLLERCANLHLICLTGQRRTIDIDGCLCSEEGRNKPSAGYSYAFRSGAIEAVDSLLLSINSQDTGKPFRAAAIESAIIPAMTGYFSLLESFELRPPIAVFLSLLNVRGYSMTHRRTSGGEVINRDHIYFPEVIFNNYPKTREESSRAVLDYIWNACGFVSSPNFDSDGNWIPG